MPVARLCIIIKGSSVKMRFKGMEIFLITEAYIPNNFNFT